MLFWKKSKNVTLFVCLFSFCLFWCLYLGLYGRTCAEKEMAACEKWPLLRTKGYGQQMPSLAVLHLQPHCNDGIARELNIRVRISLLRIVMHLKRFGNMWGHQQDWQKWNLKGHKLPTLLPEWQYYPLEPRMLMVVRWSDETPSLLPSLSTHYPTKQFVLTKPQVGGTEFIWRCNSLLKPAEDLPSWVFTLHTGFKYFTAPVSRLLDFSYQFLQLELFFLPCIIVSRWPDWRVIPCLTSTESHSPQFTQQSEQKLDALGGGKAACRQPV